jgi:uncharacterized protein (DUF1697 family)
VAKPLPAFKPLNLCSSQTLTKLCQADETSEGFDALSRILNSGHHVFRSTCFIYKKIEGLTKVRFGRSVALEVVNLSSAEFTPSGYF